MPKYSLTIASAALAALFGGRSLCEASEPPRPGAAGPEHRTKAAKPERRPIEIRIDHVTIAGSDLDKLRRAFASIGLETDYGGAHSNGLTHMALLGFDDGSYIELVSTVKPGEENIPIWKDFILHDGGPCGWAAVCDDVEAEAKRVAELGVKVQGPVPGGRAKPDGTQLKWKLAFLGDQPIGAVLPFLIEDVTPRSERVQPSKSVAGSELTGVAYVVIGVRQEREPLELFQQIYGSSEATCDSDRGLGARLGPLKGLPVVLARPTGIGGWLEQRIKRFGEAPVAILLGTKDLEAACKRFGLKISENWFGHAMAWFDAEKLGGVRIGVISSTPWKGRKTDPATLRQEQHGP